jgi:hypothetical protein
MSLYGYQRATVALRVQAGFSRGARAEEVGIDRLKVAIRVEDDQGKNSETDNIGICKLLETRL